MLKFSAVQTDAVQNEALATSAPRALLARARSFYALTKPRVVSLIVFTAVIGMFLATPGMVPLQPLVFGTLGIALVAGAAAAMAASISLTVGQLVKGRRSSTRALASSTRPTNPISPSGRTNWGSKISAIVSRSVLTVDPLVCGSMTLPVKPTKFASEKYESLFCSGS